MANTPYPGSYGKPGGVDDRDGVSGKQGREAVHHRDVGGAALSGAGSLDQPDGNGHPERSGPAHMFSTVVFSQDHGVEQPDRRSFEIAAAQIDRVAVEIATVGDSLANDIAGARNAGWRGIWLNREGTAGADRAEMDAQISNLSQLPLALRHIDTCGDTVQRTPCSGETHER